MPLRFSAICPETSPLALRDASMIRCPTVPKRSAMKATPGTTTNEVKAMYGLTKKRRMNEDTSINI